MMENKGSDWMTNKSVASLVKVVNEVTENFYPTCVTPETT